MASIQNQPAAAPPPPGVVPDFVHPESRSYQVITASAILSAVVIVSTLVRIYVKFFITRSRTWEDYAGIAGTIAVLGFTGVTTYKSTNGFYGKHEYDVTQAQFTNSVAETTIVSDVLYAPVVWMVKLSLSLLILHIFHRLRWIRYAIGFSLVYTFLYYFGSMIYFLVVCTPRSRETYVVSVVSSRCGASSTKQFIISHGVVNVFSDLYLLFIPIPAVWSLQLPTRKKLEVIAMFMVGLLACIASVLGIVFRVGLWKNRNDVTWIIETNLGIVTGSMPAFTIAMRHHGPSISSSFHDLTAKIERIVPDASIRLSKRLFSGKALTYGGASPRSDSYIELRHGIKVQHEFVVSEVRSSTAALPQVPGYFVPEVNSMGTGKKG